MIKFIMGLLRKFYLKQSGVERASPNDWVKRDQISYNVPGEFLAIKLPPNVKIFSVADTNSMDGLIDIGHNVIATDHFDKAKLLVGDIIIFQIWTTLIVHRIVEVWEDRNGRLYRTRGDNNIDIDPYYLRDVHIKWLVLGIFY